MLSLTKPRLSADKAGYAGKKLFAILFVILFTSSLLIAQETAELQKKIQSINDVMAEMMVSGDEASMWEYYSEDVISMPSYQPMMKGIEACKKSSQQMMESGMKITAFKSTNTDVMVSGDFVVDIGTYEITLTAPQMGDMPWSDHGKYMTIWEVQDDGSLKVKVETWNTDGNPWEEMQKMQPPPPPPGKEGNMH
jgi:ketosteroid isomerase-like protein